MNMSTTPLTEQDKQICRNALSNLMNSSSGLLTCVASSVDGFIVAEVSQRDANGERLAAMSSSATAVADAVISELGYDKLEAVIIEASKGKIIVLAAPNKKQDIVLLCACSGDALIGQVLYNAKNAAKHIIEKFNQ